MKKHKVGTRRIFDFRRGGVKPGHYHCCGLFVTELTDEHAPPKRTRDLIESRYLIRNSLMKVAEHNHSKRNLPPAIRAPGGFKFKTFCRVCQEKTQRYYGSAFFNWTCKGLEIAKTVKEFDSTRVKRSIIIQPLNVIKQMASNALAVADFCSGDHRNKRLQRFVQHPAEKKVPQGVRFLLYLNPIRPNWELPQCRFEHDQTHTDLVRGINVKLIAEIAVPPFGVAVLAENGHRLSPELRSLTDICHFVDFQLDEHATVELDIPVRTIFGGCALRFWQDAIKESSFDLPV